MNSVWALLHEEFCKNWEDNIKMMPKLRTYIKFKKVLEVEPYILSFMSRQRRSYLAQLRNGILPLQLEVGRCIVLHIIIKILAVIVIEITIKKKTFFIFNITIITNYTKSFFNSFIYLSAFILL